MYDLADQKNTVSADIAECINIIWLYSIIYIAYQDYLKFPDNHGKQCLVVPTSAKIKNPAGAEFSFLLVRKLPKTSETNRNGLAAHLKNA